MAVPLSTAVLAALIWWLVGRVLRPVEAIRAEVDRISRHRLDRRVPEPPTADEVARLAHTMNAMLERLAGSAERQRRFVADAAHELRSPLARIRAELEVDAAHPASADPAATHASVLEQTVALQRLVDDLLLLARGDAGALGSRRRGRRGSRRRGRAAGRRARAAVARASMSGTSPPSRCVGDEAQLARAVANLLDNAVRYAHTAVTVTLRDDAGIRRARRRGRRPRCATRRPRHRLRAVHPARRRPFGRGWRRAGAGDRPGDRRAVRRNPDAGARRPAPGARFELRLAVAREEDGRIAGSEPG